MSTKLAFRTTPGSNKPAWTFCSGTLLAMALIMGITVPVSAQSAKSPQSGQTTATALAGPGSALLVAGPIGFTDPATPMLYVYQSGTANPERAVVAHSPAFPDWGLFYNDPPDVMVFKGAGIARVSIPLFGGPFALDVAGAAHATSFPVSSDARLKENITPLTGVLDKLEKIRGVSFDWNKTYASLGRASGHREIGVIAQEVEAVFPELVTRWGDDGYRAVDYGRLTGVLIEAVKALRAENEKLEQRVETLESLKTARP